MILLLLHEMIENFFIQWRSSLITPQCQLAKQKTFLFEFSHIFIIYISEIFYLYVRNLEIRKRMHLLLHKIKENFYTVTKFANNVPFLTCEHHRKSMLQNVIVGQATYPHFCEYFATKKTTHIEIFKINWFWMIKKHTFKTFVTMDSGVKKIWASLLR